ncbi:MAG: alpha/beta hydrolase, partial [Pseudomonadales bacterium]|nr:alpha/beta hydrolase [Pseudomonadales bacterium]
KRQGVPCVTYTSKSLEKPDTDIIYFHGGGYVIGSVDGFSLTLAKLALASNARVIGVDYRLAPENKTSSAQEDAMAVSRIIAEESRLNGNKVVLAGDSAGGALSVATALAFEEQNLKAKISACVLLSPWVAPLDIDGLALENEEQDLWDGHIARQWSKQILSEGKEHEQLIDFRKVNLAGLPPTYVQVAEAEILINQVDAFTNRLRKHGISCKYDVFEDQFHVFQTFAPLAKEADVAITRIGEYIKGVESILVENTYSERE